MSMRVTNYPPMLMPRECWVELTALSKATLIDLVWDLCAPRAECCDDPQQVMAEVRKARAIVLAVRKAVRRPA